MIFRGTFEHSLDAKNRLTIPARYRAALAGGAVLACSPEAEEGTPRCVAIWRPEDYESYVQSALQSSHPLSSKARHLRRILFNNSVETELDAANRLMIPGWLREYGGLTREVVVTGSGECLEVWDRGAYGAYNAGMLARFPEIAASFDHTD